MRGSNVSSSKQQWGQRHVTGFSKIAHDGLDVVAGFGRFEAVGIFEEDFDRADFSDDADGFRPHVPGVFTGELETGLTEGLTGESGSDEIHFSTQDASPEGSNIVPNREQRQHTVPLSPQ